MKTAEMQRTERSSGRLGKTFVGVYYLFTALACISVLFFHGRQAREADSLIALFYIAVTTVFYIASKGKDGSR